MPRSAAATPATAATTRFWKHVAGGQPLRPTKDGNRRRARAQQNAAIEEAENNLPFLVTAGRVDPRFWSRTISRRPGVRRGLQFSRSRSDVHHPENRKNAPGLFGGGSAASSRFVRNPDGNPIDLPSKSTVHMDANDVMSYRTPGGGGYGPATRSEAVLDDVINGKVSLECACDAYGVAIDREHARSCWQKQTIFASNSAGAAGDSISVAIFVAPTAAMRRAMAEAETGDGVWDKHHYADWKASPRSCSARKRLVHANLHVAARMSEHGHGIRERAGWHEDSRFLAEQFRGEAFQSARGRIFSEQLVAGLGLRHSAAHGGGRSDKIATEIDHPPDPRPPLLSCWRRSFVLPARPCAARDRWLRHRRRAPLQAHLAVDNVLEHGLRIASDAGP